MSLERKSVMKKLMILLTMLPLVVLADVAPMSRGEWWEWNLRYSRTFPATGYALAILAGVILTFGLIVRERRRSRMQARAEWTMAAILFISLCVGLEFISHPFSSFLFVVCGESYEEYQFYQSHCRKCGMELSYHQGRYCPRCHPERNHCYPESERSRFGAEAETNACVIHGDKFKSGMGSELWK